MPDKLLRKAAFIDRDGVINKELNYVYRVEDFLVLPGVFDGLRLLQNAGYLLIVVTNQSGIGRGYYTEHQFHDLTTHLKHLLSEESIALSGVYFCPHHPTHGIGAYKVDCKCRKPNPGLLLQAATELHIDLQKSVMIGDKSSDIEAGRAAGVQKCILVNSGHRISNHEASLADAIEHGLKEAAQWYLENELTGKLA